MIGCSAHSSGCEPRTTRSTCRGSRSYERWRLTARDTKGRELKGNSTSCFVAPELPEGKINISDAGLPGDAHRGHHRHGRPTDAQRSRRTIISVILAAEIIQRRSGLRGSSAPTFNAIDASILAEQGVISDHTGGAASLTPAPASPPDASDSANSRSSMVLARLTGTCAIVERSRRAHHGDLPTDARRAEHRPRPRARSPNAKITNRAARIRPDQSNNRHHRSLDAKTARAPPRLVGVALSETVDVTICSTAPQPLVQISTVLRQPLRQRRRRRRQLTLAQPQRSFLAPLTATV